MIMLYSFEYLLDPYNKVSTDRHSNAIAFNMYPWDVKTNLDEIYLILNKQKSHFSWRPSKDNIRPLVSN